MTVEEMKQYHDKQDVRRGFFFFIGCVVICFLFGGWVGWCMGEANAVSNFEKNSCQDQRPVGAVAIRCPNSFQRLEWGAEATVICKCHKE